MVRASLVVVLGLALGACSSSSDSGAGSGGTGGSAGASGSSGGSGGSGATVGLPDGGGTGGGAGTAGAGGSAGAGAGGTAGGGGSAGASVGASCTSTAACAPTDFCRFVPTDCTDGGAPRVVTLGPGTCRSRTAPCQADYDCAHGSICENGACKPFPDSCNIAPQQCPAGCQWDTGPCACVCATCP